MFLFWPLPKLGSYTEVVLTALCSSLKGGVAGQHPIELAA